MVKEIILMLLQYVFHCDLMYFILISHLINFFVFFFLFFLFFFKKQSSRNSGDVWGSGLGNHFANLSINSDLGVSDSSFLSPLSSNEQNLYPPSRQTTSGEIPNLFQNNPLSSNHQGYTPQFLWTDRVENPDNRRCYERTFGVHGYLFLFFFFNCIIQVFLLIKIMEVLQD